MALPSSARGVDSIPGQGAMIPHASWSRNQNIKQKQYFNKFSKDFFFFFFLFLRKGKSLSRVRLFATPPSMGFSRQGHWSGLPFPSPSVKTFKKWSISNHTNKKKKRERKTWIEAVRFFSCPLSGYDTASGHNPHTTIVF